MTEKEWLRTGEVASMWGVAPSTVYRAVEAGELPATRVRKQRRIRRAAALAWGIAISATTTTITEATGDLA